MTNINFQRKVTDIIPPSKSRALHPPTPASPPPPPKKQIDIDNPKKPKSYSLPNFPNTHKNPKNWKAILVVLAALAVYVVVSLTFSKLKLELVPKSDLLPIDETLELSKSPKNGELIFSEISLVGKKSGEFVSTEKRSVTSKARGTITIKNDNSEAQVLVANTRFESPSGKIYRIEKQVVVPKLGYLDAEIMADKTGPEYNEESLVDFTLPGLKEQNSPKFKTIYGKSKTKITGGFSGTSFVVGENDVKDARSKVLNTASLETKEDLVRKLPSESFLLAQSIRYLVSEENIKPNIGSPSENFSLEISGAATGAIVNRRLLEEYLSRKSSLYDKSHHLVIKNLEEISFEILDFKAGIDKFKVRVKGMAQLEMETDKELIFEEIFKNKMSKSSQILMAFPFIDSVKVSFRPFWFRSFPKNQDGIDIKITSR